MRRCVVSALDRLAEIEQRVEQMTTPDPTGMRIAPDTYLTDDDRAAGDWHPIRHIAADLRSLVAALRAVLDLHEPFGSDPGICAGCEDYAPCPTVRAITEALGGGA